MAYWLQHLTEAVYYVHTVLEVPFLKNIHSTYTLWLFPLWKLRSVPHDTSQALLISIPISFRLHIQCTLSTLIRCSSLSYQYSLDYMYAIFKVLYILA